MDLKDSLDVILDESVQFTSRFYQRFLNSYPDVQQFFEGVDMKRQAVVLNHSLVLVAEYARQPHGAVTQYLNLLGWQHYQKDIPQTLYSDWRDCLLETLEEVHGEQWTDTLEANWRNAIHATFDAMLKDYGTQVIY